MAKHEFGIMADAPQPGKRYDEYEPWKYDCISVDDDYVEGIAEKLGFIDLTETADRHKKPPLWYYPCGGIHKNLICVLQA